jgi:hypothetical protein
MSTIREAIKNLKKDFIDHVIKSLPDTYEVIIEDREIIEDFIDTGVIDITPDGAPSNAFCNDKCPFFHICKDKVSIPCNLIPLPIKRIKIRIEFEKVRK